MSTDSSSIFSSELLDEGLDIVGLEGPHQARPRLDDLAGPLGNLGRRRDRQRPVNEVTVLVIAEAQLVVGLIDRRDDLDDPVAVLPLVDRLLQERSISYFNNCICLRTQASPIIFLVRE